MSADAVAATPRDRVRPRAVPTLTDRLQRWAIATIPIATAALAFVWYLRAELHRMYGMTSPAWDFAYDQQIIYNVSIGQGFYSSFARANFLGIHFELIFVVLAAVEKLWPNPAVLLIFSSAGLAATAPAAYLFFRSIVPENRAASPWMAVGLAAPIPFWAATQEAALDFFHPENMALALALFAAWAGIRGHRVAMWVLLVLVLTCKEDQIYTVGVIGLLMAAYGAPAVKKHWRFIVYLSGAWFLVCIVGLQTYFRAGGYSDFVYYGWLFMHPTPHAVLNALLRPEALLVVAGVIAGMGALPLLAPRWFLLVIPPYLADVLSAHTFERVIENHYVLILMFPLLVAGGVGARNLLLRFSLQPAAALAVMLPALILAFGTGRFPPMLVTDSPGEYLRPDSLAELRTATSMISPDACVSADPGLTVWLANRHGINDFPDHLEAACYIVIERGAYLSGPTTSFKRQDGLDSLSASGRRILYDNGRFQVWSPVSPPAA